MQKKFRIKLVPGGLKGSYLQTVELRAYLPESVFGGDGPNDPAEDFVWYARSRMTDVPPQKLRHKGLCMPAVVSVHS